MSDQSRLHVGFHEPLFREAIFWTSKRYTWFAGVFGAVSVLLSITIVTVVIRLLGQTGINPSAIALISACAFFGYIIWANVVPNPMLRLTIRSAREFYETSGPFEFVLDKTGVTIAGKAFRQSTGWSVIAEVIGFRNGTGLRVGSTILTIPDACLPDGMTAKAFRERLGQWRQA